MRVLFPPSDVAAGRAPGSDTVRMTKASGTYCKGAITSDRQVPEDKEDNRRSPPLEESTVSQQDRPARFHNTREVLTL